MSSINFAIVGCGRIAARHAEHINNTKFCELVACCDIAPKKAKELGGKFKVDKRKSHLSMLICDNQMSRDEALILFNGSRPYPSELLERDDKIFFCKKLKLSFDEFDVYMNSCEVDHRKFKSDLDIYDFFRPIYQLLKKILKLNIFKS